MACPSSRSKVTTHTHSSQEEKRDHRRRRSPPCTSTRRGEPATSNRFIITGSDPRNLLRSFYGPPSQARGQSAQRQSGPPAGLPRTLQRNTRPDAHDASGCKSSSVKCHLVPFRVAESGAHHSGQQVRRRYTLGQAASPSQDAHHSHL